MTKTLRPRTTSSLFELQLDVVDLQEATAYYRSLGARVRHTPLSRVHTDTVTLTGSKSTLQKIAREHYEQEGDEFADAQVTRKELQ